MKSLKLSSGILEELKNGNIISGSKLSNKNNVSRTAIWKKINILKSEGYDIRSIPRKGYYLTGKKECFTPEEIFSELNTKTIGKKILFFEKAGSTNDLAYQYALKNNDEGAVFIAESQTNGRGRMGREWFSPKGKGLWFSLILKPKFNFSDITLMPLLTAVACAETIKRTQDLDVNIKWPNDLLVNNKKIGGILLEMKAEIDKINFLIIGIGIDVNLNTKDYPKYLKDKASSLKIAKGNIISRVKLLVGILENIENRYLRFPGNKNDIIRIYSELCCNLGKMINVETQTGIIKGKAIRIDESGCLILKDKSGKLIKISSGDIIN
ncbi:MAG: biotin--[acetyl-CoA-carboxylase] ligase [bacterium]|nr:biotin--[acetyl-CoA-carboxylase] ligase [bacterium]